MIFSSPNISLAVVKEKASVKEADLFAKSKGQTQICIFDAQIYSFLFRHFEKGFRKSLEISSFIKETLFRFDFGNHAIKEGA